jgi:hypothetical protein
LAGPAKMGSFGARYSSCGSGSEGVYPLIISGVVRMLTKYMRKKLTSHVLKLGSLDTMRLTRQFVYCLKFQFLLIKE